MSADMTLEEAMQEMTEEQKETLREKLDLIAQALMKTADTIRLEEMRRMRMAKATEAKARMIKGENVKAQKRRYMKPEDSGSFGEKTVPKRSCPTFLKILPIRPRKRNPEM